MKTGAGERYKHQRTANIDTQDHKQWMLRCNNQLTPTCGDLSGSSPIEIIWRSTFSKLFLCSLSLL